MSKYVDLTRKMKKLWNMWVTEILTLVGTLGMVPKNLEKRLEQSEIDGRIEAIQTTA